jgi:hypothetical protein
MSEQRRSGRKRTQTQFLGATQALRLRSNDSQLRVIRPLHGCGPTPRAAGVIGKELLELAVGWFREAAGSGGCSSTCHGRLGAGVTISFDAVPAVFRTGLIKQHPICSRLFCSGRGMQGNSNDSRNAATAAATAAHSPQAVQRVYERFETACDDLDSGLFDLDDSH